MSRTGAAILREMALIKASPVAENYKQAMLNELNEELAARYSQLKLPLSQDAKEDQLAKPDPQLAKPTAPKGPR